MTSKSGASAASHFKVDSARPAARLRRMRITLIHALKARGLKKGVASLCIGGGEATAIAIELV